MNVTYTVRDGLGFMTLSNPPSNTLTEPAFEDPARLRAFLDTKDIRGIIVRGGAHFCSGADLGALETFARDTEAFARGLDGGKRLLDMLFAATVPVAAVITGSCLGAGLEIALACHFRFAAKNALLGFPETDYGIIPGLGGTVFTGGFRRGLVIEMILSGRLLPASEALACGLVDEVASRGDVENRAIEFLGRITRNRPPSLIRTVMQSIHNAGALPREEALREETRLFCEAVRNRERP